MDMEDSVLQFQRYRLAIHDITDMQPNLRVSGIFRKIEKIKDK